MQHLIVKDLKQDSTNYCLPKDKDKAFEWLEKAYEERAGWVIYVGVQPIFDGLRSDPRFAELLRRVGLPQ